MRFSLTLCLYAILASFPKAFYLYQLWGQGAPNDPHQPTRTRSHPTVATRDLDSYEKPSSQSSPSSSPEEDEELITWEIFIGDTSPQTISRSLAMALWSELQFSQKISSELSPTLTWSLDGILGACYCDTFSFLEVYRSLLAQSPYGILLPRFPNFFYRLRELKQRKNTPDR